MTEVGAPADRRVEAGAIQLFLAHWRGSLIGVALFALAAAMAFAEHLAWAPRIAWLAVMLGNDLAQAAISLKLERAPQLEAALPRWMPALRASIFVAGATWGLLPALLAQAPPSVQLEAAMLNAMLMFCVANAPGTAGMLLSAYLPCTLLTCGALLARPEQRWPLLALLAVFGVILFYGLRLQQVLATSVRERQRATDLAEELRRQQDRLIVLERERTLLLERERLMRDMHDGLGSALASSLAAAERGRLSGPEMAQALRECVDDLRVVIDSLEPFDHDVVALLATLRFRLQPRLAAAGIVLDWSMDEVPPLPWLQPPEALQLMRALQEALGNVVRHAGPCRLQVSVRAEGDRVRIAVTDDGRGFDPEATPPGRGLRHLRQRVQRLNGTLDIVSRPGAGTALAFVLPLAAPRG